jgi:hypothetical protein
MNDTAETEQAGLSNRIKNGRQAIAEAHERHDRFSEKPLTFMGDLQLFVKGFFGPKTGTMPIIDDVGEIHPETASQTVSER